MTEPEIREVDISDTPVKPVEPVQFYGPHGSPAASRDFRPSVFVFKEDEEEKKVRDDLTEDGHGNVYGQPASNVPHPSQSRRHGSAEQLELEESNDGEEAPDSQVSEEETARKSPGIAAPLREQPSSE